MGDGPLFLEWVEIDFRFIELIYMIKALYQDHIVNMAGSWPLWRPTRNVEFRWVPGLISSVREPDRISDIGYHQHTPAIEQSRRVPCGAEHVGSPEFCSSGSDSPKWLNLSWPGRHEALERVRLELSSLSTPARWLACAGAGCQRRRDSGVRWQRKLEAGVPEGSSYCS
jgi:hypothetical protein